MRWGVILLTVFGIATTLGTAGAALIQEDFDSLPVGPGVPPGCFEGYHGPGATWEIIDIDGNHVLKGVSGPPSGGDGSTGPDNGTGWFVENAEVQVSMCIESGRGGGIGIGQFDGFTYTGNSFYIEVSIPHNVVLIEEEGMSGGTGTLDIVDFSSAPLQYGVWYDLRVVSTGTTFQVWFRPHTTDPWQTSEMIIDVPHDINHPGHKSYVDAFMAVWTQNNGGPSTVLFDDFYMEAAPFPAPVEGNDDFENMDFSLANWSQHWCTLQFPSLGGSQVAGITGGDRSCGIGWDLAKQYYTYNFALGVDVYVEEICDSGVAFGWEGTATQDTDFHVSIWRTATTFLVEVKEEQNSTGGSEQAVLAGHVEPMPAGPAWYSLEILADYERFYVWLWPKGEAKPATPVINVAQDILHPGYRLKNWGTTALYLGTYQETPAHFDNFWFEGVPVPSENTSEGSDVEVQPEEAPEMNMTFDTVTEGGTTTVEVSDTAPGGGPGGLEFEGVYYDIDTTCVYDGPIVISLAYDDTGMTLEQEQNLRLMHWVTADQTWEDVTVPPVDTVNNIITGQTDSLSVFAIAATPQFVGFLSPINMPPEEMSVFKQKRTVPVKFRLLNARTGEPVTDAEATISGQLVMSGEIGDVNEPLESKVPDVGTSFRYCEEEQQYIYNLSTKNLMPGCVYRIHANIMDGLLDKWVDIALR